LDENGGEILKKPEVEVETSVSSQLLAKFENNFQAFIFGQFVYKSTSGLFSSLLIFVLRTEYMLFYIYFPDFVRKS
jgi:hypothetical protein